MAITDYYLEPANYVADHDDIVRVRHAVFVVEQNIPEELEFDELDPLCHHVLARDNQGRAIGTGRLTMEGKLGRLAVLPAWRRQRVGESLVRTFVERARGLGLTAVTASAQVSVLGFYQQFGFNPEGAVFMEADIPHQTVRLNLRPLQPIVRQASAKSAVEIMHSVKITTGEANVAATVDIIANARRDLYIYSRDLECSVYAHKQVVAALKQFALRQRNGSMQIIIQEPERLRNQAHPVIELAQRLPSHLLLRAPVELEDLNNNSVFVVNDNDGYLFRLQGSRSDGHWSTCLPAKNRQLRELFDQVWQRSRPCSEFRALGL